eukprot:2598568-Pyramimonas_sp.AAC.1
MSAREIFWKIIVTETSLCIRRLKRYQIWRRSIEKAKQVLAAIYGNALVEEAEGIARLDHCDRVFHGSAPWALQVQ